MVNHQKGVQQETAYSVKVIICIPVPIPISFFHVSMTPFGLKTI